MLLPDGWIVIDEGFVAIGDKRWSPGLGQWLEVTASDIDIEIHFFIKVIRCLKKS